MNKKLLIIVFVILVVLGFGYLLKSKMGMFSSVDTSNWSTYTNKKYGYSLKYPTNATYGITVGNANDPKIVKFQLENALGIDYKLPGGDAPKDEKRFSIVIDSAAIQGGQTLDQLVSNQLLSRQAPQPLIKTKILLDGEDAYYLEYSASEGGSFQVYPYSKVEIYTMHNGIRYTISGIKIPKNLNSSDPSVQFAPQYESLFKAVIDSFKFTTSS